MRTLAAVREPLSPLSQSARRKFPQPSGNRSLSPQRYRNEIGCLVEVFTPRGDTAFVPVLQTGSFFVNHNMMPRNTRRTIHVEQEAYVACRLGEGEQAIIGTQVHVSSNLIIVLESLKVPKKLAACNLANSPKFATSFTVSL